MHDGFGPPDNSVLKAHQTSRLVRLFKCNELLSRGIMSDQTTNHPGRNSARLWARFLAARAKADYFSAWLELQAALVPALAQGLVVAREQGETFIPICSWPAERSRPEELAEVAERCLVEKCGLVSALEAEEGRPPGFAIAFPFFLDQSLEGVVALESYCDGEELKSVMERLQWGVAWLELFCRRQQMAVDTARQTRLSTAIDLLAVVMAEEHLDSAALALATELASALDCDRVSIGFLEQERIKLKAVSHSASFGKKMDLARIIAEVMEEAILMRREISLPLPADQETVLLTRSHEKLAGLYGRAAVLTLPFYGHDRYLGAITLERPLEHPFAGEDLEFCRGVAALAFPALEEKRLNDRSLFAHLGDTGRTMLKGLLGPGHYGWKLAGVLLAALGIFLTFATGQYRLSTNTILEGQVRRVVSAPFNGYIAGAAFRAGDRVEKGALLCTLDDRDLRQERLNWLSKGNQYQRQYQDAEAKHNRVEVKILEAQLNQAAAELALVEEKLTRTKIRAPFAGLLVSGDLSTRLGGFVEQGEVLYELTPLEGYRVILEVDERRIVEVTPGQTGKVLLAALPRSPFPFVVEKVTPIATAKEGRNFFRVEAALQNSAEILRPGMEGVGKIDIDRRLLVAIWTRDLGEWLRLFLWKWWP